MRFFLDLKLLLQTGHSNGRSLEWTRVWTSRFPLILKRLLQIEHWNGCSSLWTRVCATKRFLELKLLLQTEHSNKRSFAWTRACTKRWVLSLKCLLQFEHSNWSFSLQTRCRLRPNSFGYFLCCSCGSPESSRSSFFLFVDVFAPSTSSVSFASTPATRNKRLLLLWRPHLKFECDNWQLCIC